MTVANFVLNDAVASYEDRAVKPVARFELSPLDVTATGASLDLTQPLPVKFDATINGTAKLTGTGNVVPEPFAADVDIDLAGLPLQALQPYANGTTDLTIRQGTVSATGKFSLAPAGAGRPELQFAGDATIADFKSIDNALEQDFLNFERVELSKLKFALAPDSLGIDRVRVVKPFARVIVSSDAVLNVSAVFDPQGTAAAVAQAKADQAAQAAAPKRKKTRAEIRAEKRAEEAAAQARKLAAAAPPPELKESGMPIRIREVQIAGGTMDFADFNVQPNFAAAVESLDGSITGMSSDPNSRATVELDGNVGEYSPVLISGTTQPFAYDRFTDITFKFENISLPVFNPYSGKFAGYNIAKGKLFTDLHYQIDNRKLDGTAQDPHRPARVGRSDREQGRSDVAGEVRDLAAERRRWRDQPRHSGHGHDRRPGIPRRPDRLADHQEHPDESGDGAVQGARRAVQGRRGRTVRRLRAGLCRARSCGCRKPGCAGQEPRAEAGFATGGADRS